MNFQIMEKLYNTIKDRKNNPKEGSYTNQLLDAGENKIIKKLGEENAELILALLKQSDERVASETADYIYHLMVALESRNISFEMVLNELEKRHK